MKANMEGLQDINYLQLSLHQRNKGEAIFVES